MERGREKLSARPTSQQASPDDGTRRRCRHRKGSPLPLSLRMEKNVICLLLGRRVIKTLVRYTAGKHGAHLVDLIYKLTRVTLGKRKAKKLVKRTLNVIAEISVLTMHGKLSPHQLDLMRQALLTPLKKFQEMMQERMDKAQNEPWASVWSDHVAHQRDRFIRSVRKAEKELFLTLAPLLQERTLHLLVKVARSLRDPQILLACWGDDEDGVKDVTQEVFEEMLKTVEGMAEEERQWCLKKSRSRQRRRGLRGRRTRSKFT